MSTNANLTPSDENPLEQAITIQPSAITAYPAAGDWMQPGGNEAADALGGLALVHALRRHWLVILSTGLACAAVTATFLWLFVLKPQYTAVATLQLAPVQPVILGKTSSDQTQVINEFEIFRDTQLSLIKSRYVIMAALRNANLKNRPCIVQQDAKHNAVAWLTDEVRAEFTTKNAGIMQVSAREPDKEDAAAIVNSVVDAYLNEVVNRDQQQRRTRLSELEKLSGEKDEEVRGKRQQLNKELEINGAGDQETMAQRGTFAISAYSRSTAEYEGMRSQMRVLLGKQEEANRAKGELPTVEIPDTEVIALLGNDPVYRDLKSRLAGLEQIQRMHVQAVPDQLKPPPSIARQQAEYTAVKRQKDEMEQFAREQIRTARRIALDQEIRSLASQADILSGQIARFEKEVQSKRNEADAVGKSSVNAQSYKADVENVERVARTLAEEREHLKVELNSDRFDPRVRVLADDPHRAAEVPEGESRDNRLLYAGLASLLAMLMPGMGIVVWDLRKGRINSTGDVSKRLSIPVMGAVPRIPAAVMRRLGDSSGRGQIWKTRFTESVDGVSARLLRKAECDQTRVVLITSAMSGEGKTTLATQLAMSLARAQRRTVLVDFDLRQPTLDGALGLPRGPGICEALRGEKSIVDIVQHTETEGLSVVTAGVWNRQVPPALSNGMVGTLLEQLRANFDFVIIDSSPLLPIVDARLVCQHVDAVVLSVFRDLSQSSKILAAHEMLDAFGVRSVEAVVTGGEEHGSGKNLAYLAATVAEPVAAANNDVN
jgi:capsular exopolysaccharide synthesis family protein